MNYFELHVGDYDAATAHLSMLEDAAYGRMLRVYYRTEAPLPREVKQVCRLVRAQSKPERDAVEQVLREFFELADDGWHQPRADAEIARFKEGEPEREARKANEETRLQRHRQERAALFKVLNDHGQHAPWNTKIEELRRLAEPFKGESATAAETHVPPFPATAPATPATATHGNVSPPPTTQGINTSEAIASGAAAPPTDRDIVFATGVTLLTAAGVSDRNARSFLAAQCKTHGERAVRAALERCATERPIEPVPWLVESLKSAPAGRAATKPDRLAQANAEVARRYAERTGT